MADRRLFASPLLSVCEFICPPADEAWHDLNEIGDRPIVVFPRVPVGIKLADGERVLATPNLAMLYNPGQLYQRDGLLTCARAGLRSLPPAREAHSVEELHVDHRRLPFQVASG